MRVFISWSGELSRQLGEAIRSWLPSTLQHVKPYFTPNDIDKGAKWASEISKELSASAVCIIVLTRENLTSSWIMFEAGAISSTIENSRVCPIIFDIEPTDLQGPLAQFQATRFVKADIRKLFNTINSLAAENKLDDAVADTVFEKWWPDLESAIGNILEGHTAKKDAKKIRSDRELIEEILLLIRASEKDKAPPSTPPLPYERTIAATIMTALKEIVEEDDGGFITRDFLHTKLREIEAHAHKLGDSRSRTIMLDELSSLVDRTKPRPQQTKVRQRLPVAPLKPVDDDDDIPF